MRVAMDVSVLGRPEPTGVERAQATLLAAVTAASGSRGLELVPVAAGRVPLPLWRETLLPRLLAERRVDVFHSPVAAVPLAAPCPVVATLHELPWLAGDAGRDAGADVRLRHRARTALTAARADRIVCVSRRTREHLVARHPAAAARSVVIPHGVDPRFRAEGLPGLPGLPGPLRRQPEPDALAALAGWPFVLAVGRLRLKKNLGALLDALANSRSAAGHALVLAGPDGDASAALRARASAPDLCGRIVFAGHVPDDDLAALYRAADLVAFPSLFEGFGLPVLEAMASGTPVLASRQGAAIELLLEAGDAEAGGAEASGAAAVELCDARDVASIARGLDAVLGSPARAAGLAAAGRRQALRFTAERAAAAVIDLWEGCAAAAMRR